MAITLIAGLAAAASSVIAVGFTTAAFTAFAIGAGLSLVSRALMPKPDIGTQMGGQSVTTREAAHSRKIVYGRARIGGNIVYLESTGTDNKYLWLVIAVAGHEIDAYESVWFNDEKIWDGTNYLNNWGNVVNISFYKGDQTAADSALVSASNSKWTTDHKLLDTAYMVVKLTHDPEKFSSGLPNISTIIRGKKVLNPSNNQTAWSQNPALCIYDYLRDTKYGLSETAANILTASVITARGVCDEAITLSAGGTQPRYTIDGVVDTSNSIKANIETMVGSMAGRLVYSGGKFEVHAGKYISPSITVDESQVIGEITVQTKQSRRNAFNGVKGVFLSEEDNYILADYPAQISAAYAVQDGDPIYLDMALPYTSNNIRAQRLAKLALFRSRQQEAITIPCNLSALRFKIGDNISVTNTRLGYNQKVFEVVGYAMDFSSDGRIVVNVDAIETAASIWNWQASDEEVFLGAGEVELYDGSFASAPTNLSVSGDSFLAADGTFSTAFNVSFTDADDAFTDHYVVEHKLASASSYFSQATKNSPFTINALQNGQQYNVRVKAVNELNVSSVYISATPTAASDTTACSVPSSVSATGQYQQINVNWINPTQNDFSHVDVYRATSSGGTYLLRGKSAGTSFADTDLAVTSQFFYKVKSVDYTGNASAFSGVVNATTTAEPINSLVTTTRIESSVNTNAPTNSVFAAFVGRNPINGDIVFVTYTGVTPNTQVAYQRVSGSWVAQSNIISGDVIEDKSIVSDNLSSNSVSPSKIIAHATSLVNPVSASGNVYRYGGYDDTGNIVNAIPSSIAVSFNSSENGLSIANAQNSSVRTDSFAIDSNSVYKIKLQIKKTSTGGAWYVGANQYTSFTNGVTSGSNGQTSQVFGIWNINRNTQQGAANAYFAFRSSVTDTNYDEIVCFFLGSDVDINEVPNHLIPSDVNSTPYIQFNSASTHGGLRILNWDNGSTNRALIVKNITVQRMTANSIVAENIDTNNLAAITADLGAVTAGSLSNSTNSPSAGSAPTGSQSGTAINLSAGSFTFGNSSSFLFFNTSDGLVQGGLTPFNDNVSIYYQGSSAPSSPSDSAMTYSATGAYSFNTNPPTGWTLGIPSTTDNIYVVQADIARIGAGAVTASWSQVSLLRSATVTGTSLATSPSSITFFYANSNSTTPNNYSNTYTVTASGAYSNAMVTRAAVSSGTWSSLASGSITVNEQSGDTGQFTIGSVTYQATPFNKIWSWTVTHTASGSSVSQSTRSLNPSNL